MSDIAIYLKKLSLLDENIDKVISESISKKSNYIVGKIKIRLFNKGLDGNLKLIGTYSARTITEKKDKNQRTSFVTLRDSGDWYNSMFAEWKNKDLITDSSDEKTSELEYMYSKDILALTEEEKENIVDTIIEPELIRQIEDFGNLDFSF